MNYVAILGRQPEFGLVELESLLGAKNIQPLGHQACLLERSLSIDLLGGVQKIGRVLYQGPKIDLLQAPLRWHELASSKVAKAVFGVSFYGTKGQPKLGLEIKKLLGKPARYIAPKDGQLTAAQIKFNRILPAGFELLVVVSKNQMVIACTEQVQDIDGYSARDFGRPARSAKVGMLPPKLAQIMVNTTPPVTVYDPFCGTGVILQEALLQDRMALGSDLAPEMVEAAQANLAWLGQKRHLPHWQVVAKDARFVKFSDQRPIAIVTEGYLGPPLTKPPTQDSLSQLEPQLLSLYRDSLLNWSTQLARDAEVTLTIPAWRMSPNWHPLPLIDHLGQLGYTLKSFAHADARNLIYGRPNQIVGRQLLALRKT